MDNLVSSNLSSCFRYRLVELCVHIDSIPSSTDKTWRGVEPSRVIERIALVAGAPRKKKGGEYGKPMMRCVSVCSTLMEEL